MYDVDDWRYADVGKNKELFRREFLDLYRIFLILTVPYFQFVLFFLLKLHIVFLSHQEFSLLRYCQVRNVKLKHLFLFDLIVQEFEDVEVGDRFSFKTIELVVRALKDGVPTDIGIDIDPSRRRSLYTKTYHILKKHQN